MVYLRRLQTIGRLTQADEIALIKAADRTIDRKPRQPLFIGGCPLIMIEGWAGLVRVRIDLHRMILQVALPGDVIQPICRSNVEWQALTDVVVASAPDASQLPDLAAAYARSARIDLIHYEDQIARCGFMPSAERMIDHLVEIHARLSLSGQAPNGEFEYPVPQSTTGEILGLTPVHVNRMRRELARRGLADLGRRSVRLNSELQQSSAQRRSAYLAA